MTTPHYLLDVEDQVRSEREAAIESDIALLKRALKQTRELRASLESYDTRLGYALEDVDAKIVRELGNLLFTREAFRDFVRGDD